MTDRQEGGGRLLTLAAIAVAAVLAAVVPTAPGYAAEPGPVAAYAFEEGAGTITRNAAGSGLDGTLSGATWDPAGHSGGALFFDGTNDSVAVPDGDALDLTAGMTLEAWVYPSTTSGWRTVVMKEQPGDLVYALYANTNTNQPSVHVHTTADINVRGTSQLQRGAWSHLAGTYDGTTLRLFVNGIAVASRTVSGPMQASGGTVKIGGNAIWGEWFKGLIDDVRIYNRALSATEIASDMATPVTDGPPPPPPPPPPPAAPPDQIGTWTAPISFPIVPVHMTTTADGKVVMWDGFKNAVNSERVYDPVTGTFTPIPTGRNLFCAVNIKLPDGRVLSAGGHILARQGTKDLNLYSPATGQWTRGPDMVRARWYPSATTLADGRVFVISGDEITSQLGAPRPLIVASNTTPEIYDPAQNSWTPVPSAARRIPLYPFMFVLPNGRLFDAGPDTATRTLDLATGTWSFVDTSPIDGHSAVMYRPGKILKSGSWSDPDYPGLDSTNAAAAIDMTAPTPAWRSVAPMQRKRGYHTLTALPDGTVLATGGGYKSGGVDPADAVLDHEIWDPVTDRWTTVASTVRPRLYHSSATLLPDGRILLAGGGALPSRDAPDERNGEIFSPPYLHKGPRPTIASAPTTVGHGTSFAIQTPDAASIDKVSLVRMSSVTHNIDADQRFQHLSFSQVAGGLRIDAPVDANTAPPGLYQLFILNASGVPSVAAIVTLPVVGADSTPPGVPGGVSAVGEGVGGVRVSWSAASDDVGVVSYRVHRSQSAGFVVSDANRVGLVSGLSFVDSGLAAGTYRYRVVAVDGAGNVGAPSAEVSVVVAGDTVAVSVSVSVTAPVGGAVVSGSSVSVSASASASDDVGVSGVRFFVDGVAIGAEDLSAPYAVSWNTTSVGDGARTLSAVARDAAGNTRTSAEVTVTVDNAPVPPPPPPAGGLVAGYGFEEPSGSTVSDVSGGASDGVLSGAVRVASARFGRGLAFDGIDDWVTVPDASGLDLTSAMTLEAWVYPSTVSGWRTVLLKEQPSDLIYALYAGQGTQPWGAHVFTTDDLWQTAPAKLPTNAWSHLAATYDGTMMRLFVNGSQVASRALSGPIRVSSGVLRLGGNAIWGEWFKGTLDEVRIYNRALTAGEIQTDMTTPVGAP